MWVTSAAVLSKLIYSTQYDSFLVFSFTYFNDFPVWTREFDEASSRYFLHNKGTGESKWENEGGRYSQYETDEGVTYYVPEGGGESVWYLPENAEIVQ